MFCPQCGQQQVAGVVRFCSRCGFPLDGVMQLLSNGGSLPVYRTPDEPVPVSARRKGLKQGGLLLLSGAVIVPILAIFANYGNSTFLEILAALSAVICFIGGPLRMLFAAIFEEGAKPQFQFPSASTYNTPAVPAARVAALPPQSVNPAAQWRQPTPTAEINAPPSVTDSTTKLLDKGPKSE